MNKNLAGGGNVQAEREDRATLLWGWLPIQSTGILDVLGVEACINDGWSHNFFANPKTPLGTWSWAIHTL